MDVFSTPFSRMCIVGTRLFLRTHRECQNTKVGARRAIHKLSLDNVSCILWIDYYQYPNSGSKSPYIRLTFKKSLHSPWSIGPPLLPSNSTNLIPVPDLWITSSFSFSKSSSGFLPSLSLASRLISASGACTKHVKWSSVSSFGAVWLSFEDADSVWTLAKRGVVERMWARSKGVLSCCGEAGYAWEKRKREVHTLTFNNVFLKRTHGWKRCSCLNRKK